MKVGLIYTSTTPELIELVEREVKKQLGGGCGAVQLTGPQHPDRCAGGRLCDHRPRRRLISMYMKAAQEGCEAMLNLCSSVGGGGGQRPGRGQILTEHTVGGSEKTSTLNRFNTQYDSIGRAFTRTS